MLLGEGDSFCKELQELHVLTASGAARFRPPRRFMSLRRFASGRYRSGSMSSSSESSVTKMTVRLFTLWDKRAGCFAVERFTVAGKAYWRRCVHFPQVRHHRDSGPSSETWLGLSRGCYSASYCCGDCLVCGSSLSSTQVLQSPSKSRQQLSRAPTAIFGINYCRVQTLAVKH